MTTSTPVPHLRSLRGPGWAVLLGAMTVVVAAAPADPAGRPQLRVEAGVTRLVVDGRPYLIRGGELGNSSADPDYLRGFWPKLKAINLNTVLAPVYWDVMEPAEGRFDFAAIDGLIAGARAQQLRLVLLWFGSWKNSMSCYAPAWVKTDPARFPRAQDRNGRTLEILSPFSPSSREADTRAFAALMRHLRETDDDHHTVLMVQVENEIGMIPDARDHSAAAETQFHGAAPEALLSALRARGAGLSPELRDAWTAAGGRMAGTWEEVFGPGPAAEEIFMAWHFARYVQSVAAAGKAEYPLPMYVNAALIRPGYQPGQYPSAGPLPHLIDVWRAGAPAIDFLSPDIYFPNFAEWAARFARAGNPLFVPEALRSDDAAILALYAFGQHDAIGFCPFAIESITEPAQGLLAASYDLIGQLTPVIIDHEGRGTMAGLLPVSPPQPQPQELRLGGCLLHVSYERAVPAALADGAAGTTAAAPPLPAGGLVIATGPDEFIFAGTGITVTFESPVAGEVLGILNVQEGRFVDGVWQGGRWLNGDQTHQGRHLRLEPGRFAIQRIKLYRYR
jgi:beta-galactosidase GanA